MTNNCFGVVAQLVRAPPCHGGGRGFESRWPRSLFIILPKGCKSMPGRKSANKNKKNRSIDWGELLRLDESYTSLILGIVVVILASLLLITLVRGKHTNPTLRQETSSISIAPTQLVQRVSVTQSPVSHVTKPTPKPTMISLPTIKPTSVPKHVQPEKIVKEEKYTVQADDDLWDISLNHYGSGYNWVDIAKVNHLANPGMIFKGDVLILPAEKPIQPSSTNDSTQIVTQQSNQTVGNAISGDHYTVQKGDNLWNIAVRAYNNGYMWTKIAQSNHLRNPDLIFSGNELTIPR